MADTTRPSTISGGCLCGAIRYSISFPNPEDWPPLTNGVCNCTMCRKHSGSLLPQNCGFPRANISPALESSPSYKSYASSPHTSRGFCSTCGSPLNFCDARDPGIIEINLGSIDEADLIGTKDEAAAWEDAVGRHVPRIGGWGQILCSPRYHIYAENEIPGVTDGFAGDKYLLDKTEGKSFHGRVRDLKKV